MQDVRVRCCTTDGCNNEENVFRSSQVQNMSSMLMIVVISLTLFLNWACSQNIFLFARINHFFFHSSVTLLHLRCSHCISQHCVSSSSGNNPSLPGGNSRTDIFFWSDSSSCIYQLWLSCSTTHTRYYSWDRQSHTPNMLKTIIIRVDIKRSSCCASIDCLAVLFSVSLVVTIQVQVQFQSSIPKSKSRFQVYSLNSKL